MKFKNVSEIVASGTKQPSAFTRAANIAGLVCAVLLPLSEPRAADTQTGALLGMAEDHRLVIQEALEQCMTTQPIIQNKNTKSLIVPCPLELRGAIKQKLPGTVFTYHSKRYRIVVWNEQNLVLTFEQSSNGNADVTYSSRGKLPPMPSLPPVTYPLKSMDIGNELKNVHVQPGKIDATLKNTNVQLWGNAENSEAAAQSDAMPPTTSLPKCSELSGSSKSIHGTDVMIIGSKVIGNNSSKVVINGKECRPGE